MPSPKNKYYVFGGQSVESLYTRPEALEYAKTLMAASDHQVEIVFGYKIEWKSEVVHESEN